MFVGCNTGGVSENEDYNNTPLGVIIPQGLEAEKIKSAISRTLINREWKITNVSNEQVEAELIHRGYHGKVILKVSGEQVKIFNYSEKINSKGKSLGPAVPMGWLKNLNADLSHQLSTAQYQN